MNPFFGCGPINDPVFQQHCFCSAGLPVGAARGVKFESDCDHLKIVTCIV